MKVAALILAMFLAAASAAGQGKEITRDEYYGPRRVAQDKGRTLSRRNISKTEIYKDGKASATDEWTYEYVPPEKIRYIHIETEGEKMRRNEQIDIGKTKYCRKDNGPWELVQTTCVGGFVTGMPNSISITYSVEVVKLNKDEVKLFREYSLFQNGVSRSTNEVILSYSENLYWLGKDGLLIREETRDGLVDSKTIDRLTVGTYLYDPNLKIEAPIK